MPSPALSELESLLARRAIGGGAIGATAGGIGGVLGADDGHVVDEGLRGAAHGALAGTGLGLTSAALQHYGKPFATHTQHAKDLGIWPDLQHILSGVAHEGGTAMGSPIAAGSLGLLSGAAGYNDAADKAENRAKEAHVRKTMSNTSKTAALPPGLGSAIARRAGIGAAGGAVAGAAGGALNAEEGHGWQGALQGGALGATVGGTLGAGSGLLQQAPHLMSHGREALEAAGGQMSRPAWRDMLRGSYEARGLGNAMASKPALAAGALGTAGLGAMVAPGGGEKQANAVGALAGETAEALSHNPGLAQYLGNTALGGASGAIGGGFWGGVGGAIGADQGHRLEGMGTGAARGALLGGALGAGHGVVSTALPAAGILSGLPVMAGESIGGGVLGYRAALGNGAENQASMAKAAAYVAGQRGAVTQLGLLKTAVSPEWVASMISNSPRVTGNVLEGTAHSPATLRAIGARVGEHVGNMDQHISKMLAHPAAAEIGEDAVMDMLGPQIRNLGNRRAQENALMAGARHQERVIEDASRAQQLPRLRELAYNTRPQIGAPVTPRNW